MRYSTIFLEIYATLIEGFSDEIENAAEIACDIIHHVLVANRQITKRHLRAIMVDEVHDEDVVARDRLELVGAEISMCQMMRVDGEHDIERVAQK